MPPRVLLAGLFHETHTFLPGRTELKDFARRDMDELWSSEGDGSPLAGALEVARERGWHVVPAIDLRATPGPIVADDVIELFWERLEQSIRDAGPATFHGIFLVLHGACASEALPDVEGELLERLNRLLPDRVPIGGVLDLHANVSQRMARLSHCLVAYQQNPHTDACQAAMRGALLLDRAMATGCLPRTVWRHPPLMWPPTGTGTQFEPMQSLEAMARRIEQADPRILAVNVFPGFSFADTPDTGVAFTAVTTGDLQAAAGYLDELAEWAVANRHLGCPREPSLDEILDEIQVRATRRTDGGLPSGPVVIAEPADNIGGGAPGDATHVLAALVARGIGNAAVALWDPAAVQQASRLRPGQRGALTLGGHSGPLAGGPLTLQVELVSTSDGRFALEDPHSHLASMCGSHFEMGPCAVVRHQGIDILLTTRRTPPFDLGQWRSQGIHPERLDLVVVKAAVAHRRAYDPIAGAHYTAQTAGPCASNLRSLPFRNVRRPIFPLDEIA